MIPAHVARRLEGLHNLRARVDAEIRRIEAQLRVDQRRKNSGVRPSRRSFIQHGTNSGYQWHLRHGLPLPEDGGHAPCGCREAHAAYTALATRRRKAARRLSEVQAA